MPSTVSTPGNSKLPPAGAALQSARAQLIGREGELETISAFLGELESGPGIMDIWGPPGIGKTLLLDVLVERATLRGHAVHGARTSPAEASFSYAALGDLLAPALDADPRLGDELPPPQRLALDVCLLRQPAPAQSIDIPTLGSAIRSVVASLAASRPVVVFIDDVQWLDQASAAALAFAFRRVTGLRIGLATTRRAGSRVGDPSEALLDPRTPAKRWTVTPGALSLGALFRLVEDRLGFTPSRRQLSQIERLSGGNPFYALEFARSIRDAPAGSAPRLSADVTATLRRELERLPEDTRRALLLAATHRAPSGREVPLGDLDPAEAAEIVTVDEHGRVSFTQPAWALTVHDLASASERRWAHSQLATLSDEPEERARHRALASGGPDEDVAQALEDASQRAELRDAGDAATELVELALTLTPADNAQQRLRRSLRLGRLLGLSDLERARRVLEAAVAEAPDGQLRADALLELGIVVWNMGDAGRGIQLAEEALATSGDDGFAALVHARLSWMREGAEAAADEAERALQLVDRERNPVLAGFAMLQRAQWSLIAGRGMDRPAVEEGLRLQDRSERSWMTSTAAATFAKMVDDFSWAQQLYERYAREAEASGDDAGLASNLAHLAEVACRTGDLAAAEELVSRALETARGIRSLVWEAVALHPAALLEALRGRHAEARARAGRIIEMMGDEPDPVLEANARGVLGLVALSDEDFATADHELTRADDCVRRMAMAEPAMFRFQADHVEAVVGSGDLDRAEALVERLGARRRATPKPWTVVMAARTQGLLLAARGELEAAEACLREAIAAQAQLEMPFEHARNHLLLGSLLRRRRRRTQAAQELERAIARFQALASPVWAERGRLELDRLGITAGETHALTPSEERIARLAGDGLTNRQIAERLAISPKTVEASLSRAYAKLGISRRAELGRWAAGHGAGPMRKSSA